MMRWEGPGRLVVNRSRWTRSMRSWLWRWKTGSSLFKETERMTHEELKRGKEIVRCIDYGISV